MPPAHIPKTILLVEDEADILHLVADILARDNYCVLTASSGNEAVQRSRDHEGEINLLLTDIQMPGMTGIDLAKQLSLERPQVHMVLMSGFTESLTLDESWRFLRKPFVPSALRALIADVLSNDQASAQTSGE